jgi:hypothetical protein
MLRTCVKQNKKSSTFVVCNNMYWPTVGFPHQTIYFLSTSRRSIERVEIDLLKAGRIPSQDVFLGKAKKTIVEYDDITLTYDSVCSYVNIGKNGQKDP